MATTPGPRKMMAELRAEIEPVFDWIHSYRMHGRKFGTVVEALERMKMYSEIQAQMLARLDGNIKAFLRACGGMPKPCRACGEPIWYFQTTNQRAAPYTADLLNHFADCPSKLEPKYEGR